MKVSELMDLLDAMPSEYEVAVVDGEERKELDYMMNIGENCVIFIKPFEAEGGKHDKSNIMAVCRECHDAIHKKMREAKKNDGE